MNTYQLLITRHVDIAFDAVGSLSERLEVSGAGMFGELVAGAAVGENCVHHAPSRRQPAST